MRLARGESLRAKFAGADSEFTAEETVEKRELIEAMSKRDGADGLCCFAQRAADGLQAHLVEESGERLACVAVKLPGKCRTAHAGERQQGFEAHRLAIVREDKADRARNSRTRIAASCG